MRLTAAACICVALASSLPLARSTDEIVLGMSAAFSGPSAALGRELYRGSLAYFAEVNARGGVNGRPIRIRAMDDGYEPVRAIRNTIALVEQEKIPLLFGYVGTPTVARVLPLIKRYRDRGVFLLFPFTGAQPQREPPYNDVAYNLRASYMQETAGLVDNFVGVNRRRIAVFYQADAYGRSGWDGVRRALAAHGATIVSEATYRRGTAFDSDMSAQVRAIREGSPDAVIAIGAYAACAAFVRDAVYGGLDVPIANVSFVGSESLLDLLQQAGTAAGKDYTSRLINSQVVPSYEDLSLPAVSEYRALVDKHRPDPPRDLVPSPPPPAPSFVGFEGFLNARLVVEILERSGTTYSAEAFRAAVSRSNDVDLGLQVPIVFGPGDNQALDQVYYTVVRNGRFQPLREWREFAR
jgi:ABC-type branched-subunit amino acid transport system substrate-binding protein